MPHTHSKALPGPELPHRYHSDYYMIIQEKMIDTVVYSLT